MYTLLSNLDYLTQPLIWGIGYLCGYLVARYHFKKKK